MRMVVNLSLPVPVVANILLPVPMVANLLLPVPVVANLLPPFSMVANLLLPFPTVAIVDNLLLIDTALHECLLQMPSCCHSCTKIKLLT